MSKSIGHRFLVILLACLFSLPALANEDISKAASALKAGNYAVARSLAGPLAENGNPDAQLLMGIMAFSGLGISRDESRAMELYRMAAEQGQAAAMHNLASMHYRGEGVPINFAKAREWNKKAAESGLVMAQHDYAAMLESGVGGEKDLNGAARFYDMAARAGYPNAAFKLARLMKSGPRENPQMRLRYLCMAASKGHQKARAELGPSIQNCR